MIIQKIFMINGQKIHCEIHYKNIKNCYLRVRDGKVVVSASSFFDETQIEALIRKNQDMILKQLLHSIERTCFQNHGYVTVFGKKYELIVKDMKIKRCVMHDHDIYIYDHNIKPLLEHFLKKQLLDYIEKKVKQFLHSDFDLPLPDIQIRKMKSRWGACFYQKNKVTFNFSLVYLAPELIDYVIVHELCHFIEPNHSRKFYNEIEKRLPSYRLLEKKLKETAI